MASEAASASSPAIAASMPATTRTAATPAGSQRENGRGASAEATGRPSRNPTRARAAVCADLAGDRDRTPARRLGCAPVTFTVQLGLLLAFVTALMSVLGFLLKHRGAVAAPAVEWRRPVGSTIALFRSPVYALGCVVATTSWGFHVGALALAPISLVQSVIAGGLVLVTVLADRFFGHDVSTARVDRRRAHRGRPRVPRRHAGGDGRRCARRPRPRHAGAVRRARNGRRAPARRPAQRERTLARGLGRADLGGLGRDDQGAERQDRPRSRRRWCTPTRS